MEEFNKELEEIKNELDQVKLSDEFKQNLKIKMQEELNKPNIKEKVKTVLFPRKLVAAFACFILVLTSIGVFADEIEGIVANIFSNTDKQIEEAIANGNYKKIDMEYVEHDGIGIKVDYIIQEDDVLSVAFTVKSEEEFDRIVFEKIYMKDEFKNIILDKEDGNKYSYELRKLNKKEEIIIYKILRKNNPRIEDIEFEIENIKFIKNNKYQTIINIWKKK